MDFDKGMLINVRLSFPLNIDGRYPVIDYDKSFSLHFSVQRKCDFPGVSGLFSYIFELYQIFQFLKLWIGYA